LKVTIPTSSRKIYHSPPEIPEREAGYYSVDPVAASNRVKNVYGLKGIKI
jgi:hypothetical protein